MSDEKTKAPDTGKEAAGATYQVSDGPKSVMFAGKERFAGSTFSVTPKEAAAEGERLAWFLSTGAIAPVKK